jgi:hypothetical protein
MILLRNTFQLRKGMASRRTEGTAIVTSIVPHCLAAIGIVQQSRVTHTVLPLPKARIAGDSIGGFSTSYETCESDRSPDHFAPLKRNSSTVAGKGLTMARRSINL